MFLDNSVRLVSRWLLHPQYGINPMFQAIPRTSGPGIEDPPMDDVTVENDSDHENVAKNLEPSGEDGIVVWGDSSSEVLIDKGGDNVIARQVAIAIAYVTRDNVDALSAIRKCGYLMRGGTRSLRRFNRQRLSNGFRELNGIEIDQIKKVKEQRVTGALGNIRIWGFLIVEAIVIENDPI